MTEAFVKFVLFAIWIVLVIGSGIFSLMVSWEAFCVAPGFFAKFLVIMTTLFIWCNAINIIKRM